MLPRSHVYCQFRLPKIEKANRSAPIPRTAACCSAKEGRSRRLRPQAICHGTTRLETCAGDEIRVWTLS
jgi:hypothetical protein